MFSPRRNAKYFPPIYIQLIKNPIELKCNIFQLRKIFRTEKKQNIPNPVKTQNIPPGKNTKYFPLRKKRIIFPTEKKIGTNGLP